MKKMRSEGFSIVEISLVLAIAGLIFIMTFIALPALQKSERDTERRESVIKFIDTLKKYQQNTRGSLPSKDMHIKGEDAVADRGKTEDWTYTDDLSWGKFYADYFTDNFTDASGNYFNWEISECGNDTIGGGCVVRSIKDGISLLPETTFEDNEYTMYIVTGATCDGDTAVKSANPRKVAVLYVMERVGVYCNNT